MRFEVIWTDKVMVIIEAENIQQALAKATEMCYMQGVYITAIHAMQQIPKQ